MKEEYKIIKSIERRHRKSSFNKMHLLDMLINIKSRRINIYSGEWKEQLQYIKRGNKVWNGDVKLWAMDRWGDARYMYEYPYRFAPKYGHGYKSTKEQELEKQQLPF